MTTDLKAAYETTQSGCVWITRNEIARIWATGKDRIDLLHRMSTNDLLNMAENEGRETILTNAVGRIVDRIMVVNLGERALLLGSPGKATDIRGWLARYIFFQDEVNLADATDELGQIGLYGAQAQEIVEALAPGAAALPYYYVQPVQDLFVLRAPDMLHPGFEVIAPRAQLDEIIAQVEAAGAAPAPATLFDLMRIEAGLPGPGNEISEEYIPLEVALWDAVSFTKGCYIGQEIIARMESRGRLAKTLVGLRADVPLPVGARLKATDGSRGVVTSSAESPRLGWLGLGVIKPSAAEPGTAVTIEKDGESLAATVSALPFS